MVKNLPALQETWVWILQGPNCYPSNIKSTYKTESLSCLVERGQALGQFTRENAAWLSFLPPWTSQEGGSTLWQGERWRSHSGADVKKWVRHKSSEVPNMSCSIITFRDLKKWFLWKFHFRSRWWCCEPTAFLSSFNFDNHKIKRQEFDLAPFQFLPFHLHFKPLKLWGWELP